MKKSISFLSLALVILGGNIALASDVVNNTSNISISYKNYDVNPLCLAISKGDISKVKEIISYGIDINDATNRGMTPLMYAAAYNQDEIAKLLLENGANVYLKDNNGYTALDFAKRSNSNTIVDILKQGEKRKK